MNTDIGKLKEASDEQVRVTKGVVEMHVAKDGDKGIALNGNRVLALIARIEQEQAKWWECDGCGFEMHIQHVDPDSSDEQCPVCELGTLDAGTALASADASGAIPSDSDPCACEWNGGEVVSACSAHEAWLETQRVEHDPRAMRGWSL